MSESEGFQERLEAAVEDKRRFLDEKTLPRLKEGFRVFQSLFENLFNILHRKALIQEDPYKYEQKISEVTVPAKGDILESEKVEQLSQRLSGFHTQLEFLNTYYQFSVEFIDLRRIRNIIGLMQYIDWTHVVETSADATTAVLAETLAKITPTTDSISSRIISTTLEQMRSLAGSILNQLKEILSFQKQAYKLMLRRQLLPSIHQGLGRLYASGADKAYEKVRDFFASNMRGKPLYRDLAFELLHEEFADEPDRLRERCLEALKIPREKQPEQRKGPDNRSILLEASHLLFLAGGHLHDALRKVVKNQELLEGSRQGLGGRLFSWLNRAFQNRKQSRVVAIRYFDARTSATQTESFDFNAFVERVRRKSSLFTALIQPDSAAFARLARASEQQIDEFLKRNLGELQLFHRRLSGLSEYFRQEASQENRAQLKGIRIELSGLKNCIVRANRKRYEYVSSREEEIRLQQMGVTGPPGPPYTV
jgi:hypothetical protein